MPHVMLVEPDDDFCLSLRMAIGRAGCRVTITGSFAEASAALSSSDEIDKVVTEAWLRDGSGLVLAQHARQLGKTVFVLRKRRGRVVVFDGEIPIFVGDQAGAGAFLAQALLEGTANQRSAIVKPAVEARRRRGRRPAS